MNGGINLPNRNRYSVLRQPPLPLLFRTIWFGLSGSLDVPSVTASPRSKFVAISATSGGDGGFDGSTIAPGTGDWKNGEGSESSKPRGDNDLAVCLLLSFDFALPLPPSPADDEDVDASSPPSTCTTFFVSTRPPSSKCRTVVSVSTRFFPFSSTVVVLVIVVATLFPFSSLVIRVEDDTDRDPLIILGMDEGKGEPPAAPKKPPNKLPKGFNMPAGAILPNPPNGSAI
mmetsp:Transcript_22775/g.37142  ORF Transcript_22775/g.37142 Transcript_22775/m.37142 type:complete len:229 (+) Transcript_22775:146-832(+)